jgi:hypothetical protein
VCNVRQAQQTQQDEEEVDEFDHIDKLQQFGINAGKYRLPADSVTIAT